MIEFSRWPEDFARTYRAQGYWRDEPLTRILQAQVDARPEVTALVCGARSLSYRDLDTQSSNLAANLAESGFGHGDTALVQLPNVAEFYIVFFALLKVGVVPLNALFSHQSYELRAYADQLKPRLFIGDQSHALFATPDFAAHMRARGVESFLLRDASDPEQSLEAWIHRAGSAHSDLEPTPAGEVAFFQLSGGSTGTPKLIPRTHNDYAYSIRESVRVCEFDADTRFLCALPAPHNFTLSSPGSLGVFQAGGTVIMAPSTDPAICFNLIARHAVTTISLVPPAVALWAEALVADPGRQDEISSLNHMLVGGASFAPVLARRVPTFFGCRLQQVYGMAEGLVNYTRLDDPPEVIATTQGRPMSAGDELRVLSPEGIEVAPGEVGELAVRGPYTVRGYFRAPEHNAAAFDQDGFYHTGDLVELRSDGALRVVGRRKDQINRGGEKIAAEEIEHLLLRHPSIQQAALVACEDARLGERSVAFIVASDNVAPTGPALRRFLRSEGIADFKLPDTIRQVSTLPMTPVGKIDKRRLRMTFDASPTNLA